MEGVYLNVQMKLISFFSTLFLCSELLFCQQVKANDELLFDSLTFEKSRGMVSISWIKDHSTIDTITLGTVIDLRIDSFLKISNECGIAFLSLSNGNCTYEYLLLCKFSTNLSYDYLIGKDDCDIDEGISYHEINNSIKGGRVYITQRYYKWENNKYVTDGVEKGIYRIDGNCMQFISQ